MEIISIDAVISSYFSTNTKKEEIDFSTLSKFKNGLENKFRKSGNLIYVRYHKNDLLILASDSNYKGIFEVDFDKRKFKYNRDEEIPSWMSTMPFPVNKENYKRFFLEVNSEINSQTF